ncbi:MAG TPA: ribosome maturation factor RimM [Fimbriimonadaceae bacterium]|nr:ribosome maturation factor RimM [Fimbriimonadaceae bacterium]
MAKNVRVGRIAGAHGLKGELKVEVLTDFVERLDVGRRLLLAGQWTTVESAHLHSGRLLLKLAGIDDVDAAKSMLWQYLEAPEDERPELDEDEYVTADLVGMEVVTLEGETIGKIDDVLLMPAQDIFVVGKIMIPAVKQFVKSVDLANRRIVVELIEGMRD